MDDKLILKNRLKETRTELKLSQSQLADMVGVSRNTISSIETGQFNPTAKLALIPAEEPEPYCGGLFDERKPVPVPAVRAPFITDGDGKRLELRRLRLPGEVDRNAVVCPTVITVRGGGGMMRQHLAQSCGVAALDQAALEAIAGEREALHGTIVVYWPEMESEEVAP